MKSLLFLVALVYVTRGQAPIPPSPPGLELGSSNSNATAQLEIFLDPCCPDCKQAWPTMKQLQTRYGKDVRLLVHTFPLPYHRNSFLTSQAVHLILGEKTKEAAFSLLEGFFDVYPKFGNTQTMDMTETQVLRSMAEVAHKATGFDENTFVDKMTANEAPSDGATRVSWKYGCTRGVYGTPQFLVNGVTVSADPAWTVQDWAKLLDPLVDVQGRH